MKRGISVHNISMVKKKYLFAYLEFFILYTDLRISATQNRYEHIKVINGSHMDFPFVYLHIYVGMCVHCSDYASVLLSMGRPLICIVFH